MTTASVTRTELDQPAHGVRPTDVLRLHFAQRSTLLLTPPGIMALVFVITAIIAFVFFRTGSVPGSDLWVESSRNNGAVFWALPGFFGWLGVQTVALTFPLALSLGSTRRTFVLGTVLTHVTLAAYVTLMLLVILGLEVLTNHWFVGLYVADVNILGAGNPGVLAIAAFLGTLTVLSVGGAFAAAWVRFGAIGPTALAVGTVLSLGLLVILLVPAFASFQLWWLTVAGVTAIVLALGAQYLFLRTSSVR